MRFSVRPSVLTSPSDDGYLAYDLDTGILHHLNPFAALVLELCDGTCDMDGLNEVLVPLVGDVGWAACCAWIGEAMQAGLLTVDQESPPDPRVMSASALADLAATLRDEGEVLPAFICQRRATELASDDADMWYRLADLAHIVHRRDEARAAYQRYFATHPEDAEVEHLLGALSGGTPPPRASNQCIEQLYAGFASYYDDCMTGDLDFQAPALLHEAIRKVVGDRRQLEVLDLGCGTGLSGRSLRSLARHLVGVDLSAAMIDLARERNVYDALHVAEITRFLESTEHPPFDVIAACDSLIYFGDLRQVMTLAARRLAPNGILVFTLERAEAPPFTLNDSGRFAHHQDHVVDAAREAGLDPLNVTDVVLRQEYGEPVWGLVVTTRR